MKHFSLAPILALAVAGCSSSPEAEHWSDEFADQEDIEVVPIEPGTGEDLLKETSELGTDRTRDPGKTIAAREGNTPVGATFLGGSIVVDHVDLFDAGYDFGARIRLFDKTTSPITFEWRLLLFNEAGAQISSLNDDWKSANVDALNWRTVSDAARLHGAVRFELRIRKAGSSDEGAADKK